MKRPEQILHIQCVKWFRYQYPQQEKLLHLNHNNAKNGRIGGILKAMGMTSGVSDLEYNRRGITYFFEFKSLNGRQNEKQILFQKAVENEGFEYYIIKNFEEFKEIIDKLNL